MNRKINLIAATAAAAFLLGNSAYAGVGNNSPNGASKGQTRGVVIGGGKGEAAKAIGNGGKTKAIGNGGNAKFAEWVRGIVAGKPGK